jgi:DNA-binding transcriptional regulator WhiA
VPKLPKNVILEADQADHLTELMEAGTPLEEALTQLEPPPHSRSAFEPQGVHIASYLAGYFDARGSVTSRVKNENTGWTEFKVVFTGESEAEMFPLAQALGVEVKQEKRAWRVYLYRADDVRAFLEMIQPYSLARREEILGYLARM